MTSISNMSREDLLTMIWNTVRDEIQAVVKQEVGNRLDSFEQQLTQFSALQQQMGDVTASIDFTSKKLEDLKSSSLPALYNHVERIAEALAMQTLDVDMHRWKWSLTINGIKGASGEDDVDTRNACVQLARDHLGIPDADPNDLAACHRLARREDVGIILRFRDLSRRNGWLFGAKNLKGRSDAISISPDVPPVLRAVKKDLLQKRKALSPVDRKTAHIRHLRQWPYMELVVGKNRKIRSDIKKDSVVENILGFNALYSPQENM